MSHKVYIKNVDGLVIPSKAHTTDAAYDVIATSEPKIVGQGNIEENRWHSIDYIEYQTNVMIAPQENEQFISEKVETQSGDFVIAFSSCHETLHSLAFPRSSISKYNLVLSNSVGLIDNGFRGFISARFKYIIQPEDLDLGIGAIYAKVNQKKIYQKGDKIFQLRFSKNIDVAFDVIDKLPQSTRDIGGFGSSGN